jgi:sulfur dioxygenase
VKNFQKPVDLQETLTNMIPIQLFDAESSTFTYILRDPEGDAAVIIDPVDRQWERDLQQLERLNLRLVYVLETHAHADHVTSAGKLCQLTGAIAAVPSGCGIAPAPIQLEHGDTIRFGKAEEIKVLHTPGHTAGGISFTWRGNVFTGDTLLIDGCGRTDFQSGSAAALYDSVTTILFALPDTTVVWPAHDYKGRSISTIGWERRKNSRLANRSKDSFIELMDNLDLPRPKLMDVAVPANQNLGLPHRG